MKKNMIKISLYLTQQETQGLVKVATKAHRTNASIIRQAIDEFLKREFSSRDRRAHRRKAF